MQDGDRVRYRAISGYIADTTNPRAELSALLFGLKALNYPCRILLKADSTYVVNKVRRISLKPNSKEFETITTQYAKEQLLPMNPSKLSGVCGRLKCCLAFEKVFYISELEKYPEVDQTIHTPVGEGVVDKVDIFHGMVYVRYPNDELEKYTLEELRKAEA